MWGKNKTIIAFWKYSRLRFYIKNTLWNYGFWLFCKKKFKTINYVEQNPFSLEVKSITKRRFEGYLYKGKLYLDNPGIQGIDKDVWHIWKKKGLF